MAGAEPPSRAEEVAALLAGTFDSAAQSASDPESFRAVRLVAVRVPASRLGAGLPVLYVEQALLENPDRPYRQRFYRIEETADGGVVSRVFEPKEPVAVSGKWRDPS
ncbi:partial Phycocyanobilin lyase CpcT, partial [Planctomycetaceae bacterium]